jgi:predicted CopG family antitoxin
MTKSISLSERAYVALKKMKRRNESFSDVVIRLSSRERKRSILELAGTWKGDDIDRVSAEVGKERERTQNRN